MFKVEGRIFSNLKAACRFADKIHAATGVFVAVEAV